MNDIKKFFSPCMQMLTWGEVKNTVLLSFATSRRTFRLVLSIFWWIPTILFGGLVVLAGAMLFSHGKSLDLNNVWLAFIAKMQNVSFLQSFSYSAPALFFGALALLLIVFLFSVIALVLMRSSREAKDWKYVASILGQYHHVFAAFPLYLLSLGFTAALSQIFFFLPLGSSFSMMWYFFLLFFFDGSPTSENFWASWKKGVYLVAKFLPLIFFVDCIISALILASILSFALFFGLVGFLMSLLPVFTMAAGIVGSVIAVVAILGLVWLLPSVCFVQMAIANTLYSKLTTRFKELFPEQLA